MIDVSEAAVKRGVDTIATSLDRLVRNLRIGADVVCEALIRQGVDVFFSYPGGVILPLYDVLGDYPQVRHVLVRHEQGGAHAADGALWNSANPAGSATAANNGGTIAFNTADRLGRAGVDVCFGLPGVVLT